MVSSRVLYGLLTLWLIGCQTKPVELPAAAENSAAKPNQAQASSDKAEPQPQPEAAKGRLVMPDKVATTLRNALIFSNAVRSVAFSPDSRTLAVGTGDGLIRLWDVKSEKLVWTIKAHDNWTFDLTFLSNGDLVSGGGDNKVHIIDVKTGSIRRTVEDHTDDLHGVAVTSDGRWLVSSGDDRRIIAHDLQSGTVKELGQHDKQVTSVTISPNDKWAASSSRDSTVRLWDLEKMSPGPRLQYHTADTMSVAFSRDSQWIVTSGYDRTVHLWEASSGMEVRRLGFHDDWVFSVLFTPDDKFVLSGCGDDLLRLIQVSDGKIVYQADLKGDIADIALSPDGKLLAAATSGGFVRFVRIDGANSEVLKMQIELPQEGEKLLAPKTLSPEEYLARHQDLVQTDQNWVEILSKFGTTADPFTLHLLRKIDTAKLYPKEAELLKDVLQQIENIRRPDPETLRLHEIGPLLYRTSVADLSCHRLEGELVNWTITTLKAQSKVPEFRLHLIELRKKPSVPAGGDKQEYGSAAERIQEYIDEILSPPMGEDAKK